jgi:hypothetical protein
MKTKSEVLKDTYNVIDKFISDNANTKDIIIAWYEIKKVLDIDLLRYERERKRIQKYRLKQK